MGYRRTILLSRSKREILAVAVIAVVTAFLVGATLSLVVTEAEVEQATMELTRHATVEYVDSPSAGERDSKAIVLPVTTIEEGNNQRPVVGIPPDAPSTISNASYAWANATLPSPPNDGVLRGKTVTTDQQRFETRSGHRTFTVKPIASHSILPSNWYVANSQTVKELNQTGALVIRPTGEATVADKQSQTLLSTAGMYLRNGADSFTTLLGLLIAVEGIIVSVVIYSITRTSVVRRSTALFVARATGGTRQDILRLFAVRGGLRTGVGAVLGLGIGVFLPILTAIGTGYIRPVAFANPSIIVASASVIVPALAGLVLLGSVVGYVTARAAISSAPVETLTQNAGPSSVGSAPSGPLSHLREIATPTILQWRTVIPTAATLTVFVCVGLVIFSAATTMAPLVETSGNAVVDSDAAHPLASNVDTEVASEVRMAGGNASPEILLPEVVGSQSQPYLARGVNYTAFASVTESTLIAGHAPNDSDQAVIGADLAETLNVTIGDRLLLGGGAVPGVTRVTVVGMYEAEGMMDDQLLVPLQTARHLSSVSQREANLIRIEGASTEAFVTTQESSNSTGIIVKNYSVPDQAVAGKQTTVSARFVNYAETERSRTVTLHVGPVTKQKNVTLGPGESKRIQLPLTMPQPGEYQLQFGALHENLSVYPPNTVRLRSPPTQAPPNATLVVHTVDAADNPVPNATVTLNGQTVQTNQTGTARLPVPNQPGTHAITVDGKNHEQSSYQLRVAENAQRELTAELEMPNPTLAGEASPVATLTLFNPWDRQTTRTVIFETESGWKQKTEIALRPGERRNVQVELPLPQETVESLTVRSADEGTLATGSYRVVGANRSLTYSRGSGLGLQSAVKQVTDSLMYLQAAFLVLAGLTVLGSTSVVAAQAVYLQRQYLGIYRATGASPRRLFTVLLGDALRIGMVSTGIAIGVGLAVTHILSIAGLLTVFGVRITPQVPLRLIAGLGVVSVSIVGISIAIVTARSVRVDPASQSVAARK